MSNNFTKFKAGLNVEPKTGSTVSTAGDVAYNNSTGQLEIYVSGAESISTASNTQTLSNKSIDAGSNTLSNIANASISSSAAIAYSKLNLSGSIVNADINASAAIDYSKLNLSGSILNADINASAAIAYSKLNLSSSIVNADIATGAAIARSKIASGTNNHVIINDGSGVLSSEANLAISRGGTGAGTQTAGFNALSPLTTKGDIIVHNGTNNVRQAIGTDGQVLVGDSSQTNGLKWTTLQQGAKNYITYNNFENNATTGWSLGTIGTLTNGIPTGSPTFGSGASGNLSISTVSSGQLAGTYSLSYASSAATTQGNMLASQAYSIDIEDQAKVLTWKFYYSAISNASNANWSGTSSNSFGVAVYDVTNSTWLGTAGQFSMTQSSGVGYSTGTFQTGSTTASIRFVIYNVNATSGAVTLYFDDFSVGPQTAPMGPAMSDWVAYTPTTQGFGTLGASSMFWRRVGDSIQLQGTILAGTVTASEARIGLPLGLTSADTSKIAAIRTSGTWTRSANAGAAGDAVLLIEPSVTYVTFGYESTTSAGLTKLNGNTAVGNSENVTINALLPITGWSSNVQMSNDTDTRVIAARATGASSATLTSSYSDVTWASVVNDTHGAFSATSNTTTYTIPVTGYYDFIGQIFAGPGSVTASNNWKLSLYNITSSSIIEEQSYTFQGTQANSFSIPFNFKAILLNAGTQIKIQTSTTTSSSSISASSTLNFFAVTRSSGPAVVAATESVNAKYNITTNTAITAGNVIPYNSKEFDSHNAFSTSTSLYTIPVSGVYNISTVTQVNVANSNVFIKKNGTALNTLNIATTGGNPASGSTLAKCNAGDTIGIYVDGGSTVVATGNGNVTSFSIYRVGN